MKKLILLLGLTIQCILGNAQIWDENFDYGNSIDTLYKTGIGGANWTKHSGTNGPLLYLPSSLSFPSYPLSNIGGSAEIVNTRQADANRAFTPITSSPANVVYASFLLNVDSIGTTSTGEYFFHMAESSGSNVTGHNGRVSVKYAGVPNRYNIGLAKGSTVVYTSTSFACDSTYLLVVKYKFTSTSDTASLFLFNSTISTTEPATPLLVDGNPNDAIQIASISLRQGSVGSFRLLVDGIRTSIIWPLGITSNTPPTVSTNAATSVTSSSATLGGNVTSAGSSAVTQRGVLYGTNSNPTFANTKVNMGNGLGNFSQNITPLTANTTYHVRAFAINGTDTAYGADSSFTTLAALNEVPQTISGLQLWLDASDINNNGTNPSNNTAITTWKDRSGASNDATLLAGQNPGILTTNQINGKSTVKFTRTSQVLGSVYNVPNIDIRAQNMPKVTIFTVYKQGAQTTPPADQAIWGCDNGGWDRFFFSSFPSYSAGGNNPNNGGVSQGTYANVVTSAGLLNKTQLLTAVYDNQTASGSGVYFNGQNIATFTDVTTLAAAQTSLRIGFDGDDNCYNGDIAEMLVYNKKLTDCEIQTISKYLGNKYGVTFASVSIDTFGSTTFNSGDSVVLSSSITASSYQWLKNGSVILGATTKNYTAKQSGSYQVIATNACSDTSAVKVVTVNVTGIPQTITGLQLWLDASDVNNNGANPSNNTAITTWKDRSGAGNDAVVLSGQNAGVLTTNQINGKATVKFTRTSSTVGSVYNVPNVDIRAQNMPKTTIFTVYKQGAQTTPPADQAIWGCDNGGWDRFFFSSFPSYSAGGNNPNNGGVSQGTYANVVTNAGLLNKTQLLTAVYDNQTASGSGVYFNGQNIASFTDVTTLNAAQTTLRIGFDGDDNCYNGDIAEMIVYNRKLSDCEILSINKYLGNKYGVTFASVNIDTLGSTTFRLGDSVVLSSSITASSYQWLNNGSAILGATAKNYTAKQSGNYQVVVVNSCSDTSAIKQVLALPIPLVKTTTISNININSAVLSGNVVDSGSTAVTERGIVYATTANPTIANTKMSIGTGLGSYSRNVVGLTIGTTYHVRAYAINSAGISYGADSVFTTLSSATIPTVITQTPTLITFNSAVMGGNVTSSGGANVTERGFVYNTISNPDTATGIIRKVGFNIGTYGNNVLNLTPSTTYHVRAYAINIMGIAYGADSVFTTLPGTPKITTTGAISVTTTSATLGGNVIDTVMAAVTERGVVYATTVNPTTANSKVTIGSGLGNFSQNVTGLSAATLYHVRAYAINSVGTSYGADSTFTTTSQPTVAPTVSTSKPTLIGVTSATLAGNVSDSGTATVTERGVVYSTTFNPTTANTKVAMGSGLGTFSQNVTGLSAATTYHVRAYAINSVGTSYGADSVFTTLPALTVANVITGNVTNISNTSANLAGNVIADGGTSVTERGIVLATTANPTTANTKVTIGAGLGNFSQIITALTPNTTYHYRAYAINSVGTSYGADSIFTTLPNPEFNKNITNAFSPDGDGTNDTWVIDNADMLDGHEITVYNIFGQEVFSQTGYNTPWDGKKEGNLVPSGEYYYHIKGSKINIKGALLIKTNQ